MNWQGWKPHILHSALVLCGLAVFHVCAYWMKIFPTTFAEVLGLAISVFALPCFAASVLYSMALRWLSPDFFRKYSVSKLFALSGFFQGVTVYPLSVVVSALLLEHLFGAVVVTNALSLTVPLLLAIAYRKHKSGVAEQQHITE